MAAELGQAYVQIIPSAKGISGAIESALGGEMNGIGSNLAGGIGKGIAGAGAALAGVAATATVAATAAVTGFGAQAVNVGKEFDSAMSQVAATSGVTMEQLNNNVVSTNTAYGNFNGTLRDFAQYMGSNTSFSATQAADALNFMALAGYDAQQSVDMLPTVLNLAAAGSMDLASASDMVTDAQSALGLTFDKTNTMVDQMAMTSSKSNTSVEQLGDAFLKIGATARNVSGGTQELSTMLGVLADNGIKGTEGGTHLRNILLAMNPTTDKAAAAWEELGVQAYDAQGQLRPLQDIMLDLGEAMSGMTDQRKTEMISAMFNKTDLAAVNALLGTSAERYKELGANIGECSGAAQQMADTQLDNLAGDITLFQSALEGAQIVVSDGLTPTLRQFVQFGTDAVSTLSTAFKEGGLSGAMEALGTILSDGLNMVIEELPKMVDAGMKLLGALGQGLLDNLPTITDSAMQIVTMLVEGIMTALPGVAEGAIQIVSQLATSIGEQAPVLIPEAINTLLDTIITILENVDALVDGAIALITGLAEGIINALPILIEKLPTIVIKIAEALIENAPKLLLAGPQLILQLATGILECLPELITVVPNLITELLTALINDAPRLIEGGAEQLAKFIEGIVQTIPKLLEIAPQIIIAFGTALVQAGAALTDFAAQVGDFITNKMGELIDAAITWGVDLITNFIFGIKSTWDGLVGCLGSIGGAIADYIGFSEPDKGPLSNFHTYAPDMMALFAKGIKDNTDLVTDQIRKSFDYENLISDYNYDVNTNKNGNGNTSGGFVQNLTINAPTRQDPSEIARMTKNANRDFILQLRTT